MQIFEFRYLCEIWWQSRAVSNFCSCRENVTKMFLLPLWLKFFLNSNMSFQARCGAGFWFLKCLEVAIKGWGGTAAICLSKQELLPCRGRGCLVRKTSVMSPAFCLAVVCPHSHPCIFLPPHTENTVVLASLEKNVTFWASKFGGVKGLKVVLALKKELWLLVASISLESHRVKRKSFSLWCLCVHPCPFPATCTERGRHGHAKGSFASLVPWHLDVIQWAHTGNPVGPSLKAFLLHIHWNTD